MYQGIITRSAAVFLLATLCPAAYAFGVEFPDDDGEGVIRSAAMDVTDEFIKQLGSASKETKFEFSLFDDVSFVADTERVEKTEDGFSWIGKIAKEDVGDVILSVVDGDLAGTVWVDTQIYNIHGDGDGGYTVDEIDSTALELAHDADTSPSQPNRRTLPSFLLSRPRVVDALLAREERYKRLRGRIQVLVTAGFLPDFILSYIPESGLNNPHKPCIYKFQSNSHQLPQKSEIRLFFCYFVEILVIFHIFLDEYMGVLVQIVMVKLVALMDS